MCGVHVWCACVVCMCGVHVWCACVFIVVCMCGVHVWCACVVCRFEPVHHLPPEERLAALRELRDFEGRVIAETVRKIEHERHRRRAREFCLRALKLQRAGLKSEAQAREARAQEADRQRRLQVSLFPSRKYYAGFFV